MYVTSSSPPVAAENEGGPVKGRVSVLIFEDFGRVDFSDLADAHWAAQRSLFGLVAVEHRQLGLSKSFKFAELLVPEVVVEFGH